MRELSQRSANLRLHLGPRKNEGIAEPYKCNHPRIATLVNRRRGGRLQFRGEDAKSSTRCSPVYTKHGRNWRLASRIASSRHAQWLRRGFCASRRGFRTPAESTHLRRQRPTAIGPLAVWARPGEENPYSEI